MNKRINLDNLKEPPLCPKCNHSITKVGTKHIEQLLDETQTLSIGVIYCPHCRVALSWDMEVMVEDNLVQPVRKGIIN